MKTSEKQSRKNMSNEGRKAFYITLVSKLDPKKIYEPIEINDIVEETVNEQGGSHVHRSQYITNLIKIIGEKNYDMIEDENAKTRGRSKKYLFSLKATHEELYKIIDEFFKPKRSAAVTKSVGLGLGVLDAGTYACQPLKRNSISTPKLPEGKAESEKISEEKKEPKESGLKIPSRIQKSVDKLWTILSEVIERKTITLDFERMGKILGINYYPTRAMFERWIDNLKEIGIHVEYLYKSDGRTTLIVFKNPTNSLLNISKEMRKYGKTYNSEEILKMKLVVKAEKVERKEEEETPSYSENDFKTLSVVQKKTLWHIAGVLMEYGNRPLDLMVIGKKLHDEFGIDVSASQIRSLAMTSKAFMILKTGPEAKIQIRPTGEDQGRKSFEFLKETLSPVTSKSTTLARLRMTLEEVRKYLPESTVESEITPDDNIFRLVFNSTRRDTINLALLVMGKRGTDVFFDKGIEAFAKKRIESIDEMLTAHDSEYRIENL